MASHSEGKYCSYRVHKLNKSENDKGMSNEYDGYAFSIIHTIRRRGKSH